MQGRDATAGVLMLIDASSLAYRAYHAMPSLRAPDGQTETNAIHGFLNFASRLLQDRKPTRLIVALDDDWRPAFRVEALPTYKTHRLAAEGDPPDEVEPQIVILIEVLEAIGLSTARAPGLEAEDAIATLARRETGSVEIVTGDRDLFSVVRDPNVRVLYTLRGVTELAIVDEAWIAAKYGIPGDRYLDYALLRGDPSDGLPGVAGIGAKTASALLARYGSLDAILGARDYDPRVRARLNTAAEYLAAARRVAAPVEDSAVKAGDGALPAHPPDHGRLAAISARYGIEGPIRRLDAALKVARAAVRPAATGASGRA
jgi:5'-3' exonuclease